MKDTSQNEVLFSVFDIQGPVTEPPKAHQPEEESPASELKEVKLSDADQEVKLLDAEPDKKAKKKVSFEQDVPDPALDQSFVASIGPIRPHPPSSGLTNPIKVLRLMKISHWMYFFVAWLALYADFVDFLSLAIGTRKIALHFETSKTRVSTAITLTLLTRPIGACIFGLLSDYHGRRWPLAFNLCLLGIFQIGSIRADSLNGFICSRAFFGIGMGGVSGLTSMIFDSSPLEARGILGGLLQTAIPCASITAAGLNMAFGAAPETYKLMFWVGAAISFFAAIVRAIVPDSPQFRHSRIVEIEANPNARRFKVKISRFIRNFKQMIVQDWTMLIYCAIFVSLNSWVNNAFGNNHFTFLESAKGMNNRTASIIAMLCNIGSFSGMLFGGALSQFSYLGRRRMAIFCTVMAIFFIPAAVLPTSPAGLTIGCIFFYLFVQGYCGILPSHLNELSPKAFRAFFTGTAYQLGTMIASPGAQVVNAISESRVKTLANGTRVEAYEPVMATTAFIILFITVFWVAIGPERRNTELRDFVPAAIATKVEAKQDNVI
ncbi:MFS general substrate transporter [Meira miltonrushii]|uniref:MFS general substrate transporter n=1 Tax=Meira miltonrushii TaxID=1280837 RepID=A0A316VKW8_9BASI|nr:MFS general substrate transporter [Meira miltonrushii]PWN37718.1 MFS general substrate transporter [Meira miltonrushii]